METIFQCARCSKRIRVPYELAPYFFTYEKEHFE